MTELEQKAEKFQDTLDTVSHQLTGLVERLAGVEERLSKLEVSQNRPDDEAPWRAGSRQPDQARNAHGGGNHSKSNLEDFQCPADGLLRDYDQLKRSLERVQVDKEITFTRDRTGVKRVDHRTYNIIAKCANFAETIIKIVQNTDPQQITENTLNNIFLCGAAHLGYLREEAANLFIKGEYGTEADRLYRGVQKHSPITANRVGLLSNVVQLANVKEQQQQQQKSARGSYRGGRR